MAPTAFASPPFAPSPLNNKTQPATSLPLTIYINNRPSLTPRSPTSPHFTQPHPPRPLPWLWQCHFCHRSYTLAVTRRCLDDGHYFCAGEPQASTSRQRRGARRKCGKACASEFDYAGWRAWGRWKRTAVESSVPIAMSMSRKESMARKDSGFTFSASEEPMSPDVSDSDSDGKEDGRKDCWRDCDYPSECRWGRGAQKQREIEEREMREEAQMASLRVWLRRQSDEAGAGGFKDILWLPVIVDQDEDLDMDMDMAGRRSGMESVPYGIVEPIRACGYDGEDFETDQTMFDVDGEEMEVEFDEHIASGASR